MTTLTEKAARLIELADQAHEDNANEIELEILKFMMKEDVSWAQIARAFIKYKAAYEILKNAIDWNEFDDGRAEELRKAEAEIEALK